jgi:hypothetical protein
MTRDEAIAILDLEREAAIVTLLALAEKAEKYDGLVGQVSPTTPSGMTPVYLKPSHSKRKKPPGRGKGHPGTARPRPSRIDQYQEHTLECCPHCQNALGNSLGTYPRYIEDLPPVQPTVTEHTIHRYWCPQCKRIVSPAITEALPNAMIGLRLVVLTAWLHYCVGVSVNNLVKTIFVFSNLKITPGGLTQAWKNLPLRCPSNLLAPCPSPLCLDSPWSPRLPFVSAFSGNLKTLQRPLFPPAFREPGCISAQFSSGTPRQCGPLEGRRWYYLLRFCKLILHRV